MGGRLRPTEAEVARKRAPTARSHRKSSSDFVQGRVRRGEPRDRHAERRAGHVIHAEAVAQVDALRIAAVLLQNLFRN